MVVLIIITSILCCMCFVLLALLIHTKMQVEELETTLSNLCECFLMYKDDKDSVSIIEDYSSLSNCDKKSRFNFPNSEGF